MKKWIIALLVVALGASIACGENEGEPSPTVEVPTATPTAESTPTATATAEPTATPEPTPTPTPEPVVLTCSEQWDFAGEEYIWYLHRETNEEARAGACGTLAPVVTTCTIDYDNAGAEYTYDPDEESSQEAIARACGTAAPRSATCGERYQNAGTEYVYDPDDETSAQATARVCGRVLTQEEIRRNIRSAPLWVWFQSGRYSGDVYAQAAFDIDQFDLDVIADGTEYCNPSFMREGHPLELSCDSFRGSPGNVQNVYAIVGQSWSNRGTIFDCYKQTYDATLWACFLAED